ncbi:MAG: hypothetical protein LBM01_00025 [Christensenellaceae bacterium]|jgi:hypothetical protein|nr:hypothetical protein [Christensenellaceae bacterium]
MSKIKEYMASGSKGVNFEKEQELLDKMVLLEGVWVRSELAERNKEEELYVHDNNFDKEGNYRISYKNIYWAYRPKEVEGLKRTFGYNNGRITVITSDDKLYGAPATKEVMQLLKEAGYESGAVGVELSNGEKIADKEGQEEVLKKWNALNEQQQKEIEEEQKRQQQADQGIEK